MSVMLSCFTEAPSELHFLVIGGHIKLDFFAPFAFGRIRHVAPIAAVLKRRAALVRMRTCADQVVRRNLSFLAVSTAQVTDCV